MAVTQADVDALNAALRSGVRSVTVRGTTTIYHTVESLIQARDDAQAELNRQTAREQGKAMPKQTLMYYAGRGYHDE